MPEETHQPQGNRGRSRRERVEIARSRDILDVANELNMELVRDGKDYRWKEHDSLVISPDKNKWNWFSRHQGGDVIALVETIREINFNQAIDYLNDGTFKEFTAVEREKEPFRYHLQPYEQDFVEARNYLKVNRGLSDETIDFFLEKGVLAQANAMLNNSVEPVVVFKTLSSSGEITGATLQGIEENRAKWPARGYAKNIIRNSDGMDGLHVDIGKPNRLIFTESPIDLMSYYEINKDTLQDVRLVSMDGLKEATIGRHLAQLQSELSGRPLHWTPEQLAEGLQTAIDSRYFADGKHADIITLAVDNDTAGRTFIEELETKGAAVTVDLPELRSGQDKADWNDALKNQNEKTAENSRLTEGVNQSFDKENFIKGLELMQKYSVEEVLSRPPIYQGDDQRLEALQIDLEGFDYKPLDDFIRQYIDPNYDLDYEEFAVFSDAWNNFFRNGAGKDLTVDSFITLAKNNGLVDEVPVVEPWQALTVLEPIKTYSVKNGDLQEDFDSVSGLLDFVKQKLSETERKILEQELAEVGRGTPTDILMTIDSALVGDFDVYVNGQSIISVYPNNIDEQATVLYVRSSEEAVKDVKKAPEQSQERLIDRTSDNLKNQLSSLNEPSQEQTPTLSPVEKTIDAAIFTQVLDDVRNVGNFIELGVTVPEEAKEAWAKYIELSDISSGDFNTIVLKAEELGFLDKNSSFYQEWRLEHIYNNNYHVRFQWLEEQVNNLNLPFEEHSLVSYQDFSRELYKVNQENTNNTETNIPKIKFDIYAPGGEVIKEGVRYNIGDETKPISQMLGLGYRRLKGQPILANIDENVLSQLENQALNQEISQEAYNPKNSLATQETNLTASPTEEREFRSPKQETKGQLDQRVKEIVADNQKAAEEVAPSKESPGEIDYSQVTPHELSEIAFQKIREFTRSPEALAEYMDFMSKFPQLSPRNVALIQDQWQGANAVATYNQWQALGKTLGIRPEDVIETRNTYTNKRTGETKEVVHQGLSVKSGEKAQITLFRPLMARMIPVLDDQGNQVKNSKGNPKFKKISEATPQEKALLKERKLRVVQFQERDQETGLPKFTTYKVFELSQTTLKPESYPKALPNRQYQFDTDQVKTKEVLDGLCDYAGTLGVHLLWDEVHELGNAKGAFYPGEQKILLNPNNLPGEQIATTIHELAHATLHNPKFTNYYKENVSTPRKELEAEMTSHLVSKHFGLDTSEAAIDYMAGWTKNLTQLDDKQLAESMKRIHQTVSKMVKHIEHHTKPYELPKERGQSPNFSKSPTKGLKP